MDLQMVIGVDKRNPLFTIFRDPQRKEILIYYGGILYEVIADKKDDPQMKIMLARLYNGGVSVTKLVEKFGYSYPTIKRWGDALKSGDKEKLFYALEGRGGRKKLNPEIISFIIHDFEHIYPRNKYTYSKEIRKDIKQVFKVDISAESIRPLLGELKKAYKEKFGLPKEKKKRIFQLYC